MPKLFLANPGINESVTRPIILDLTRQLFSLTGIAEDTKILYPGDTQRAKQPGSALSDEATDFSAATLPFSNRMFVDVDEVYTPERMLATAVYEAENLPVFVDGALETWIKPVYSDQELNINFRYRSADKTQALRWRDEIRGRTAMKREQFVHAVTYSYLIPPEMMVILQEIHRLREAVAPYGETFEQWFATYASQRVSQVTTLAGTQPSWSVSERQLRVIGYFDFEGAPEKGEKDSEGEAWTISFSYKFHYEKPIGCAMGYPLMVHNQLIKYRPEQPTELLDHHLRSYALSAQSFGYFEKGRGLLGISDGVAIPSFDEFLPASVPSDTLRVFTALCSVDTSPTGNPLALMNLNNLGGDVVLDPAVLSFLIGEIPFLTVLHASPFHLSLYRDSYLLPAGKLTVDADLNVLATEALDLRSYYHVRFAMLDDLDLLSSAGKDRLRQRGDVLALILSALGAEVCIPPMLLGTYVARSEFTEAVDCSNRALLSRGDGQPRQFNTVATVIINSSSIQNHASR